MDGEVATAGAGVVVAIVTAVVGPTLLKRVESRDPSRGWQAAVSALQDRLADQDERLETQEKRIETLESEVRALETELTEKNRAIQEKDQVIREQSRVIEAQSARIAQLESAWPSTATLPPIDPALRSVLRSV